MRILAVDDDPLMLGLISGALSDAGYDDVTVAGSADELLTILTSEDADFDCMLLDIVMPDLDGIELCKWLRSLERYRTTHILMVTSRSDKAHMERAFVAGASDYLAKPFEVHELCSRLQAVQASMTRKPPSLSSALRPAPAGVIHDHVPLDFSEPISIPNDDAALSYNALAEYVLHLPRPQLLATRIFALKIGGMGEFYAHRTGREYVELLKEVAQAIASCLVQPVFSFAYAGEGVFLCIARGSREYDPLHIEAIIDGHLRSRGSVPAELSVCSSALLRAGASRSGHSIERVIRLAIDSALERAAAARAVAKPSAQTPDFDGIVAARPKVIGGD